MDLTRNKLKDFCELFLGLRLVHFTFAVQLLMPEYIIIIIILLGLVLKNLRKTIQINISWRSKSE